MTSSAHPQLPVLGAALLRRPGLPYLAGDLRHARRHRHDDRRHPGSAAGPGTTRLTDATAAGDDAAADRDDEENADDDADHALVADRACRISMFAMARTSPPWVMRSTTPTNDDTFYLPPEIFDNEDFKRGMKNFISPDGHAVRFIISHEDDPLRAGRHRAHRRHQETPPLKPSKARRWRDLGFTSPAPHPPSRTCGKATTYDLLIAGVAALTLIFIIMLLITRSVVAAGSSSAPWCFRSARRSGLGPVLAAPVGSDCSSW